MNERLQQFLTAENITQAEFADTIKVARASVSHILAGRNKPGFDFIAGMARHYPELNIEWLITGKGKMYKSEMRRLEEGSLFDFPEEVAAAAQISPSGAVQPAVSVPATPPVPPPAPRKAVKIVIFFDDDSYQEFSKQ